MVEYRLASIDPAPLCQSQPPLNAVVHQGAPDEITHPVGECLMSYANNAGQTTRSRGETLLKDEECLTGVIELLSPNCKVDHKTVVRSGTDLGNGPRRARARIDGRVIDTGAGKQNCA